jgi:hypothetical protein
VRTLTWLSLTLFSAPRHIAITSQESRYASLNCGYCMFKIQGYFAERQWRGFRGRGAPGVLSRSTLCNVTAAPSRALWQTTRGGQVVPLQFVGRACSTLCKPVYRVDGKGERIREMYPARTRYALPERTAIWCILPHRRLATAARRPANLH